MGVKIICVKKFGKNNFEIKPFLVEMLGGITFLVG